MEVFMRREDAIMISEEEMVELNYINNVIDYLIKCYNLGKNIYIPYNGVMLYSCDGYTYDEYYLIAMGLLPKEQAALETLMYGPNRTTDDSINLANMTMPIYSYLKDMHLQQREELINGKQNNKNI